MTRLTRLLFALWLIISGSFGAPQPCAADSLVTLKGESEVHRLAVRLSDVFTGVPAEIDRDIAQAPAPGKEVVYDVNVLTRLAQKYRLDWEAQSLADHVVISTACTRITSDMIRDAVVEKMKAGDNKGDDYDILFDNHTLEVDLPVEEHPDFNLNNFEYDPITKRFHGDIVAETPSGPFAAPILGHVTIKKNVPVLVKRLEEGTTISAADLDWVSVSADRVNASIVTDAGQLVGHELHRDKDEGELIHTHDIIPPRFVTRGSLVTIKIETPYMVLTAQGKALQDGASGEVVRVINTQSNRMLQGTVSSPGVVIIPIAQRLAEAQ